MGMLHGHAYKLPQVSRRADRNQIPTAKMDHAREILDILATIAKERLALQLQPARRRIVGRREFFGKILPARI